MLPNGSRLGPYEIVSALGAGGMGEVYRATDTNLGRQVAIKILPEAFAQDVDRLARFEREARLLATLNHPNIAQIYGVEKTDGVRALVMELVDGPTLADRIAQGPIPLDETLPIAKQIAEALEAAHEQGIIHRDLKPANIKVRPDGTVKVLDFGLAKALEPTGAMSPSVTQSPTITSPVMMTGAGMILGTAAYMSPEQARGRPVDKRADIWAFGCVLFEMLTAKRLFFSDEISDTLALILTKAPDWHALPPATHPAILRLLHRCLEKDRKRRLSDIGVARLEIEEAGDERSGARDTPAVSRRGERLSRGWALAIAALLGGAAVVWVRLQSPAPEAPELRLEINTPPTRDPDSVAISPDGRTVAFVADFEGTSRLWLRPLSSSSAQPVAGTNGATAPFWSPDSRSVAIFAEGRLKRIDVQTGAAQTVAAGFRTPNSRGGSWNGDDVMLFAPSTNSAILRVSASGGEPAPATELAPGETGHNYPSFFPDGRRFLYYVTGNPDVRGIYIGQLGLFEKRRLLDADAGFTGPFGDVFFVREQQIFRQELDSNSLTVMGNAEVVAEQVGAAGVSISRGGTIAHRSGFVPGQRQYELVWLDRAGKEVGKVGPRGPRFSRSPTLSPDGRRVAFNRVQVAGNSDVWIQNLSDGPPRRVTFNPADDGTPVWSPDGRRLGFSSRQPDSLGLYVKPVTGEGAEELLLTSQPTDGLRFLDWSSDGKVLLFSRFDPMTGADLWVLPLDGDRKAFPLIHTNSNEVGGAFSPDGKWMAYQSDESGQFEIYIQRFSGSDRTGSTKWQVSSGGGAQVRWRADGRELFFIGLDDMLMAVPLRVASDTSFDADAPVPLFATQVGGALSADAAYAVSRDGQRFLMNTVSDDVVTSPINVILNWKPKP